MAGERALLRVRELCSGSALSFGGAPSTEGNKQTSSQVQQERERERERVHRRPKEADLLPSTAGKKQACFLPST